MLAYLAQGQALEVKPLDQVLEVARAPLVRPQHLRFEKRYPVPRDPEGQRAKGGLEDPLVVPVPVNPLAALGGGLQQEILYLAVEGLVDGPFELGSDERIQIVFHHRGRLFRRHRGKQSYN